MLRQTFNITVIQIYAPTTNAKEAEVEQIYEDLQDILELIPKKDVNFIIREMKGREVKSLSRVQLFATPWTGAYQASQSMGFSRQEYWSGLPFNAKVGSQEIPGVTGKFGLGVHNEAGQRLTSSVKRTH